MIERAAEVIMLADSSKIDAPASLSVCPLKDIDIVITDDKIDPNAVRWLNAHDIEVKIAHPRRRRRSGVSGPLNR